MLIDIISLDDSKNVFILFNVAEDLTKQQYIKDISFHTDEVINVFHVPKEELDSVEPLDEPFWKEQDRILSGLSGKVVGAEDCLE